MVVLRDAGEGRQDGLWVSALVVDEVVAEPVEGRGGVGESVHLFGEPGGGGGEEGGFLDGVVAGGVGGLLAGGLEAVLAGLAGGAVLTGLAVVAGLVAVAFGAGGCLGGA
ncbi:hypothetical protein [Mucisphaera sp.]|uniref:hypothetical protein n=1 Tax=Mucisphaera sp. TaxID=2913024 RepID=UPI003D0D84CC